MSAELPLGYVRLRAARADAVGLTAAAGALERALAQHGTLYAWAASHPARRTFQGRAPAYAAPLPGGALDVVVRHAWHGGLLRRVTRDLFAPPTRAPGELRASARLRTAGVRTPEVVAYARYPAPLGLCRVDVATRLVAGARDLAAVLLPDRPDAPDAPHAAALRAGWIAATAELLGTLARAGARHPDLNLKNVLLAHDAGATSDSAPSSTLAPVHAWVLDVDVARVPAGPAAVSERRAAFTANFTRLRRSLDKWRRAHALPVTDADLQALHDAALAHLAAPALAVPALAAPVA